MRERYDEPGGPGHGGHGLEHLPLARHRYGRGHRPGARSGHGMGGHWRGPRARRGDVRAAVLALLAEEPRNGYQLMQEIERRSGGIWRPGSGSVYPTLQQLEDEGLVRSSQVEGGRVFTLTEQGQAEAERRRESQPAPWEAVGGSLGEGGIQVLQAQRALWIAVSQLVHAGDAAQQAAAAELLTDVRRRIYGLLAEPPASERKEGEDG